jgi:hypothetical protein
MTTRSRISDRSSSATAPITVKIIREPIEPGDQPVVEAPMSGICHFWRNRLRGTAAFFMWPGFKLNDEDMYRWLEFVIQSEELKCEKLIAHGKFNRINSPWKMRPAQKDLFPSNAFETRKG